MSSTHQLIMSSTMFSTRSSTTRRTLLDLPDDVLVKILSQLLNPSSHFARSINPACNAFSLALCNTRLFNLFPKALSSISFIHHNTPYPQNALYQITPSSHLAQLIRLAGSSLQSLHLPLDASDTCLLPAAAYYCPNIRELWYNGAKAHWAVEARLFAQGSKIRKLRVSDPQMLFSALIHAPRLQELCVIDLHFKRNEQLIDFLEKKGSELTSLSIVYCQPERLSDANRVVAASKRLCKYICSNKESHLAGLQTLKVGLKPWVDELINHVELEAIITVFADMLREPRRKARVGCRSALKTLTVVGSATRTTNCLSSLCELVSADTDVEVYFLEAGLQFPGNASADDEVYIKSFSLARDTKNYMLRYPDRFCKLEVLSVTNDGTVKDFLQNDYDRVGVLEVVRRAGSNLKHIHPTFHPGEGCSMKDVARFLATVLREASNLSFVLLPSKMVRLALTHRQLITEMVAEMKSVNMLMLVPHFGSMLAASMAEERFITFVRSLVEFLMIVKEQCPKLECLLFENVLGNFSIRGDHPLSANVRDAISAGIEAVEVLHRARPGLDAQSVATRLRFWLGDDGMQNSSSADSSSADSLEGS